MEHAAHGMRAFGGERWLTIGIAIEARAPFGELACVVRTFFAQHTNRAFVAQSVAGSHRVSSVQIGRIVLADRSSDTALRVFGVAFARVGFRDDDDVAGRRELDRGAEPRDSAADDDEVAAYIHRRYTTAHIAAR